MKNYPAFVLSITIVVALGYGFSSCKEDDPPPKPKLSFAESTMTVDEDDGVLEVQLNLDRAYGNDLNIEYRLAGTASDQAAVGTAGADYEIAGDHGVVVIPQGQTSGTIEIEIYADANFEEDETIEISIVDTNTDDIALPTENEVVITITNDDAQLVASFPVAALAVNEADGASGVINVAVQLDQTASADVTLEYTLEGTAIDSTFAFNSDPQIPSAYYDYYINGVTGEVVVPAGSNTANIQIQVFSDFMFEDDETIEITLTGSDAATIGTSNKMTVTISQQDGRLIALLWDDEHTDVDMDLFLWIGETVDNLAGVLASSLMPQTEPREELVFIPALISDEITEAAFGLSYVYYSGTADPMNFEVHFVDFTEGAFEPTTDRDIYSATYTAANINAWDESDVDPMIVQTFRIVNGEYTDLTDITVPASGSRIKTFNVPKNLKRGGWQRARSLF